MFLLIDAGNTRIKLGLHDGQHWLQRGAWAHAALGECAWLETALRGAVPPRVLISNVAGEAVERQLRLLLGGALAHTEWLRASAMRAGFGNDYLQPAQLGADRWAAAIGAWSLLGRACLVVNAGTATTIDVVSQDARFAGGCILPGFDMMRRALVGGTAQLPLADGEVRALPRATADAIVTGCVLAQIGAIERMRAQLPPAAPVVLTGGASEHLLPWLTAPVQHEPWLVLQGLLHIARSG